MQGRVGGIGDELEDEQLKQVLAQSVLETQHDPTETPNTGGSAASSSPAGPVVDQSQGQSDTPPFMTKEELAKAQELFRLVSDELADLHSRMRSDVNFTKKDMDRMAYLQPIAFECRQRIGLVKPPTQPSEEEADSSKNITARRRTHDQGIREKGVKHRTIEASRPEPGKEVVSNRSTNCPLEEIANIFNKGVEDLSSFVPSSAGKTPTSIPVTFQGSASALPMDQPVVEASGKPAQPQVVLPSDPRTATLITSLKEKLKKAKPAQSTPTSKSGDATARSTPSSFEDMD